jgi:SHS2 domain-containing protein
MSMEHFKVLDISGDVGIKAFGKSREDLFIHAAFGMYSLITAPDSIEEKKSVTVAVESISLDGLLVAWLNELIFQFDAYGFLGKTITIHAFGDCNGLPGKPENCTIKATIRGEEFDPGRHESRLLIKAATYHRLSMEKVDDHWEVEVIFDI